MKYLINLGILKFIFPILVLMSNVNSSSSQSFRHISKGVYYLSEDNRYRHQVRRKLFNNHKLDFINLKCDTFYIVEISSNEISSSSNEIFNKHGNVKFTATYKVKLIKQIKQKLIYLVYSPIPFIMSWYPLWRNRIEYINDKYEDKEFKTLVTNWDLAELRKHDVVTSIDDHKIHIKRIIIKERKIFIDEYKMKQFGSSNMQ